MTSKGSISFFFLQNLQNLKIRPLGLQLRPWGLKFGACLTCSYGRTNRCLKMSFTQCLWHLLALLRSEFYLKMFPFTRYLTFGSRTIYGPNKPNNKKSVISLLWADSRYFRTYALKVLQYTVKFYKLYISPKRERWHSLLWPFRLI